MDASDKLWKEFRVLKKRRSSYDTLIRIEDRSQDNFNFRQQQTALVAAISITN